MNKRYSIGDARANLSSIVDEVEGGAEIELTRRGKPVAVVVSRPLYERLRAERPAFAKAYKAFLDKHDLEQVGAEDDVFDGLREPAAGRDVDL
jgi:prevent-host-death family protein